MAQVEILMPKLGESVMEATITKWSKNVGDTVDMDETIVEIATDKVDSEVPSTARGVLVKRLHEEGAVVQIGDAFAIIETDADNPGTTVTLSASVAETSPAEPAITQATEIENDIRNISDNHSSASSVSSTGDRFYSPLVKSIAREEGISQQELDAIAGSGKDGRVTKDDIMAYLKQGRKPAAAQATQAQPATQQTSPGQPQAAKVVQEKPVQGPPVSVNAGDDIIEMDRMRKLIADHMVMSKRVSPHVTSFVEADVTNIVLWREKVKDAFQKMTGEKLTFTPIFMEAVVRAIKDFPGVNASVDGDRIIMRKNINVGMATALPSGNLIVPVIKNADTMNLTGLTKAVNDMAARARAGKLTPDDIAGGTYTVSNVGTFGNVMGTPIINQPQVAILALGAVRKRPAVIETEYGDVIAVRHMMFLSHSYDHRVVDGALGGSFVRRVADYLEQFDPNRTF
ncbi:MAG: dihydrolipoamide acetyltransferase family protein [Flavobacteriales bacterium]